MRKKLRVWIESFLPLSTFSPTSESETFRRTLILLLCTWASIWFLAPLLALDNAFIDVTENIIWGSHFQFGYDKNPFLGAWIGYLGYRLTGDSLWNSYLLSQIFVFSGLYAVWRLSLRITSPAGAFLSTIFLLGLNFYGIKSVELCDDVMELGFWPLLIWSFYHSLKDGGRISSWLLTGFLAGCCFMIKYYGVVLFLSMFFIMLMTQEGRRSFRTAGPYFGALLFVIICLPNLIWLNKNNMIAFQYAFERASLKDGFPAIAFTYERLLKYPLRCFTRTLSVLIVPLIPFFLLFLRREKAIQSDPSDPFHRRFVLILTWCPFALTLLFSIISGGSVNYSWVVPCFPLLGLFLVLYLKPCIGHFQLRMFTGFILFLWFVFVMIFLIRSLWQQPYLKQNCDYENFPGKTLAARLTVEWRRQYHTQLPFVIGDRRESCNIAIYSPDHPEAYFSANPHFSQWINEDEIREKGALILFNWRKQIPPKWIERLKMEHFFITSDIQIEEERAVPAWFQKLFGSPKSDHYVYCFIPPKKHEKNP